MPSATDTKGNQAMPLLHEFRAPRRLEIQYTARIRKQETRPTLSQWRKSGQTHSQRKNEKEQKKTIFSTMINTETLTQELLAHLQKQSHEELVIYTRAHRTPPDFLRGQVCQCEDADQVWMLDLALSDCWFEGVEAFMEARVDMICADVFYKHCNNWLHRLGHFSATAISVVHLLVKNNAVSVPHFWSSVFYDASCKTYDSMKEYHQPTVEHMRFLGVYNLSFVQKSIVFILNTMSRLTEFIPFNPLSEFGDIFQYGIELDYLQHIFTQELCKADLNLNVVSALLPLGTNDDDVFASLLKNGHQVLAEEWIDLTTRDWHAKDIETALLCRWQPIFAELMRQEPHSPSRIRNALFRLVRRSKIDLHRHSHVVPVRMLYQTAGSELLFDMITRGVVFDEVVDFENVPAQKLHSDVLLVLASTRTWPRAGDVFWFNLMQAFVNRLVLFVNIMTCLSLDKADYDKMYNLYSMIHHKTTVVLSSRFGVVIYGAALDGAPDISIGPLLRRGSAAEAILQHTRDIVSQKYKPQQTFGMQLFTVEGARARMETTALEMWRNFWRERCFQIALAFRSLELPDELFHSIAKAFAPPLIRRFLPRILLYRVFLAVRRFHSKRKRESERNDEYRHDD
jgi:hypothetical protein